MGSRQGPSPQVMGILNLTPDSFSDGGLFTTMDAAIRRACIMADEGADLIDLGGESTRPGSKPVPLEEELRRVVPVVKALAKRVKLPLSIDTSKAEVARQALDAGATMINDVTALGDADMAQVVARAEAPIILMHMRGDPRTMQCAPRYRDVMADVKQFLQRAIRRAQEAGIAADRILIDPGLGFGKTVTHNLLLLQQLHELSTLGKPIVIGPSRKSFIGRVLDAKVDERLSGTLACMAYAAQHGAHVIRVHDVKATVQFLTMWDAIDKGKSQNAKGKTTRQKSKFSLLNCIFAFCLLPFALL